MIDFDPRASDPLSDYAQRILRAVEHRERLALHLLEMERWSLLAVVFMGTDWAQHAFWRFHQSDDPTYGRVIRDVYGRVDAAIGTLLEAVDDQTSVIVMSDHGAGTLKYVVNLNRWLAGAGVLHYRAGDRRILGRVRDEGLRWLADNYQRYLPAHLRARIRTRLGSRRLERFKGQVESALLSSAIEWSKTRAYALGACGNLYVNLAGREPEGTVQPGAEYEQLRDELIGELLALTAPDTGQPLVKEVHRAEEIYAGPYVDQAPDLVIEWHDYAYWGRGRYDIRGRAVFEERRTMDFSDLPLTGGHRPEGVLIAQGPDIRPGAGVDGARLVDVAPTLLGLLGFRPPGWMDGRVLGDMLTEDAETRMQERAMEVDADVDSVDAGYSPDEAEQISQQLRALGYL
jgi:predicted AlkP superfamily phosphohydrolase/phosphomutase